MQRKLISVAFKVFLLAQILPAFWDDDGLIWGWNATYGSFVGAFLSIGLFFGGAPLNAVAYLLGATANLLFVVTFVASFFNRERFVSIAAWIAAACAFVALLPLFATGVFIPYIGCAVWLLGMLLLGFGCMPSPAWLRLLDRSSVWLASSPTFIRRIAAWLRVPDRRCVSLGGFRIKIVGTATLGIVVVGLSALPFLFSWYSFLRSPMGDPAFRDKLQQALGKSGGWSDIYASQGGRPVFFGRAPSHPSFKVSAVKNGHTIETVLSESKKYMLHSAVIDPYYTNENDDGKKEITVTYDGSSVVKVAAQRRYDPNVVIWEGVDQSGNHVSTLDLPLDSNEQQAAVRLADEFGFAVREALK